MSGSVVGSNRDQDDRGLRLPAGLHSARFTAREVLHTPHPPLLCDDAQIGVTLRALQATKHDQRQARAATRNVMRKFVRNSPKIRDAQRVRSSILRNSSTKFECGAWPARPAGRGTAVTTHHGVLPAAWPRRVFALPAASFESVRANRKAEEQKV